MQRRVFLFSTSFTFSISRRLSRGRRLFDTEGLPTVFTTGYDFIRGGARHSKSAVFWADGDPLNTILTRVDGLDFRAARLRSLCIALRQARDKKGIREVLVKTDFSIRGCKDLKKAIAGFAKSDFFSFQKRTRLRDADLYEELHLLLRDVNAHFEYVPTTGLPDRPTNYVIAKFSADSSKRVEEPLNAIESYELLEGTWEFGSSTFYPNSSSSSPGPSADTVPTVIVAARLQHVGKYHFLKGAFATLWKQDTLSNLPDTKRPAGSPHRLCMFPITLLRAEMSGIKHALQEAVEAGLPAVHIRSDSLVFLLKCRTGWKKRNGEPVANFFLYKRILTLASRLKVSISAERPDISVDADWAKATEMAAEGLLYPLLRKADPYSLSVVEILAGKTDVEALKGTGTPRVRAFKRGRGCPIGILWDTVDGGNVLDERLVCELPKGQRNNIDVLIHVLEQAVACGIPHLVVRTNMRRAVTDMEKHIDIWKGGEWQNCKAEPIVQQEKWKKLDELRSRIKITWDLIDELDEDVDSSYFLHHRKYKKLRVVGVKCKKTKRKRIAKKK